MNAKTAATTAVFLCLASGWASAQPAKDAAPAPDKPSAAAEMPAAAPAPAVAPAKASKKAAGPKLNMDVPDKNPGKDQDKRSCLDLPTNAEIAKCARKK
jgi:hypothetical protein